MQVLLRLFLLLPLAAACSEKTGDGSMMMPVPVDEGVTYQKDLRALVEDNCGGCHVEDGIGPFALDSYDALKTYAPVVVQQIEANLMPPWLPDPSCRRYQDERILTDEEKGRFRQWMIDGSEEGDPADYVASTKGSLTIADVGEPSLTLAIDQYTPRADRPDDYRCFILEHEFAEETYLRTSNVVPEQVAMVHHVILFLVPPQFVPAVEALDAGEAGPGYTCFGGTGAGQSQPIAGWVPGTPISPGSDQAAVRIPAGGKIVMQLHYNTLELEPAPDRTSVQLWFLDQRPPYLLEANFFAHLGIDIAPGDASSHQTRVFTNDTAEAWTIVSTAPHMHLLGRRLLTNRVALDGSEECVVDVPAWDFHWQQGYVFRDGEQVVVQPGESLRVECWYDNSRGTERVTWGESTLDEMCLNTLVMVTPYFEAPDLGQVCGDFQSCYDQCRSTAFPLTGCMLQCSGQEQPCAQCVIGGVIGCTSSDCGPQASAMLECFEGCDGATCIRDTCTEQILAFDACSSPIVQSGSCDSSVVACNVAL